MITKPKTNTKMKTTTKFQELTLYNLKTNIYSNNLNSIVNKQLHTNQIQVEIKTNMKLEIMILTNNTK